MLQLFPHAVSAAHLLAKRSFGQNCPQLQRPAVGQPRLTGESRLNEMLDLIRILPRVISNSDRAGVLRRLQESWDQLILEGPDRGCGVLKLDVLDQIAQFGVLPPPTRSASTLSIRLRESQEALAY